MDKLAEHDAGVERASYSSAMSYSGWIVGCAIEFIKIASGGGFGKNYGGTTCCKQGKATVVPKITYFGIIENFDPRKDLIDLKRIRR
ncbi:hypothetical protein FPQ18DRAFT_389794 [Pyronema domesticum]|nr:hypothetical protein FPQ18DRAFT_389794 [Pyronema domesticum]